MPVLTDMRLKLLQYTTKAYINDDPVIIAIQRKVIVDKPGGYNDKARVTLPAQAFRIIDDGGISSGISYSPNDEGEVSSTNYTLVGQYNADIQKDDIWQEGQIQYRLDGLVANNGYEARAIITAFTKVPVHG